MDKKTLKALRGSIEKWEKIWKGTGVDKGTANCPLCQGFNSDCERCPVFLKTGEFGCDGTPYDNWSTHTNSKHREEEEVRVYCPTCKRLAKLELDFLKSLLPKTKNEKG